MGEGFKKVTYLMIGIAVAVAVEKLIVRKKKNQNKARIWLMW